MQLIMSGLGILAALLIAFLGPGRPWIRWPLAIATGAGVAITGWPTLWQGESSPQFQLYQSLLLAAVIVLVALLIIMLLYPSRSRQRRNASEAELTNTESIVLPTQMATPTSAELALEDFSTSQEAGRDAIALELDESPNAMIANQKEHALMHLLATAKKTKGDTTMNEKNATTGLIANESEPLLVETTTNDPFIDQVIENEIDSPAVSADGASSADVVSLAERRVKREDAAAADALDLSDSEELYQAMRDAEAELDLPEDSTWLNDELETELKDRDPNDIIDDSDKDAMGEEIEDAEILAIDLEADTDATTADLPFSEDFEIKTDSADIDLGPAIPDSVAALNAKLESLTLEDALSAQRQSIARLSNDTDTLADRLTEWRKLSDSQEQTAWQASLQQGQTVQHQQQRILAENNFRRAAVELIRTQRDVMRQLMTQIGTLGEQREEDLASLTNLQETSLNQRRLARQAALLARKAAADKQAVLVTLRQEQNAHARTQSAAKRAMDIARNAVDKLAQHESRLGLSNNRQSTDS